MKHHLRWMWRFWRFHKGAIVVLLLLTVLSTAAALGFPLVFKFIVDELKGIEEGAPPDRIDTLIWILILVGLARSLKNLYPMFRARMNGVLEMAVRRSFFESVIGKGHRFFLAFRTGDIVTRLTDDIAGWPKIAWFLCSGIFRALESIVTLAFTTAAMLLIDVRLGLVAIAPLPVMMLAFWWVRTALGQRFLASQRAISHTMDLLESSYSGIRIVKAYNAEPRMSGRLDALLDDRIEVEMRVIRLRAFLESLYKGVTSLGETLTLGFGGFWILDGSIAIGDLFAIYLYVDWLVRPMMDIPQLFISGKQAFVCMDRLSELEDFEAPAPAGAESNGRPVPGIASLAFEGVSFRFDPEKGPPALSDVSFEVPRGRRLAVVGPVGSGKSTLARILSGELTPTSGRILVNGTALADLDLADYRRNVGYIPQEALLFSETVRENVAFGRPLGDREVSEALRIAQVEREVLAFPRGTGELLGQRGVRVSGGQRQRLAIARAIADVPGFLVMDDVTAALDSENEEALWDAITERRPDLTAVIVTHRIATARRADEILVLDAGRVAARGPHDHLLATSPLYRRLARCSDRAPPDGFASRR